MTGRGVTYTGGGVTTTGAGAYTGGGGGATTTGCGGAATTPPKMPVPERIWLNTAKAPRPSAASVAELAIATPGTSSNPPSTIAATVFIAFPPCRSPGCSGCLDAGARGGILERHGAAAARPDRHGRQHPGLRRLGDR